MGADRGDRETRPALERWARFVHRRARVVLALCAAGVVAMAVYGVGAFESLALPKFEDPDSESVRAMNRADSAAGYDVEAGLVVLVRDRLTLQRPAGQQEIARLANEIRKEDGVARVQTPVENPKLLSGDGQSALIQANFRSSSEDGNRELVDRLKAKLKSDSLTVRVGGNTVAFNEIATTAESDLRRAELVAFPILAVLLVLVFRGLVAALLPLALGAVAVVASLAGLRLFNVAVPISITALNLVTSLGLGLAVDYSLFLVSRYREEIDDDGASVDALAKTLTTAGRTVIFSALTVAAAVVSLCLFPQRFLYSMGLGGTFVTLFAAFAAIVVIPALLAVLGDRVNSLSLARRPGKDHRGRWYAIARFVQSRPIPVALVAAALLLGAGSLALGMKTTSIDATVLPRSDAPRAVEMAFGDPFQANGDAPVSLALTAPEGAEGDQRTRAVVAGLEHLDGTRQVLPPRRLDAETVLVQAIPESPPTTQNAGVHLKDVRAIPEVREHALVGGPAADLVDFRGSVIDHLPLVLAVLLTTTLVALFLLTGSILLPLKSLLMNALTLAATAGFLVFLFQDGRLQGPLGYEPPDAIELSSALLVGALAFGLSTDYGVFLLARIKELRDAGNDDPEALALATQRTGGLITAAAALFVVAIGALATSTLVFLKEIGLATAFAVIVDATLIRVLLVPSLMRLLGEANWWAPPFLRRLHDRLGVREA
jgi:RND superfamily putative drug exporter